MPDKVNSTFYMKTFGDPMRGADDGIDKAVNETLADIAKEAKSLVPVDTGLLAGSIMFKGPQGVTGGHQEGPQIVGVNKKHTGVVGTAVHYGVYQEFGTRKMNPQPFLRPAVAMVIGGRPRQDVINKINQSMKNFTKGTVKIDKF